MQIWNKNNSWHQKHDNLYWMICYKNDCTTHLSEKEEEYFSKTSKNYWKKKDKMSNLKYWKSKNISSSKQIFKKIWWQAEIFRNRAEEKTDKTDESYIILMKVKDYLQSETDNMTTCINKRLRKASQIRKIKNNTSSRQIFWKIQ